ncbi:zinc transporter 7-like [Diadema antillarum]|uniref:zinc transporter 7-like n=1 Tax=Diadema antillarum TaxID=105358 RepID=UPI003A855436
MLPVHKNDQLYKPRFKLWVTIQAWWRAIFSDQTSRNLFMFLVLNLSFAFVELAYGIWSNSLGLISDSFHMFFDCTALLAGLIASIISKWRANDKFSYGYVRMEILAGFVNALFLLFIAFFIFSEAVERAVEPPEVRHERLFVVSVLGFFVNIIGIFAFGHGHSHAGGDHGHSHGGHGHSHVESLSSSLASHSHSHGDHAHDSHGHSHDNHGHSHGGHGHGHGGMGLDYKDDDSEHQHTPQGSQKQILKGVFLHILADTLGSVGVIVSAILMQYFGWMIVDPLCSMFIALLIMISVLPLLQDSISILMMRTPYELELELPSCYQKVANLEGVYSIQDKHFWTLCTDVYVGTLKLEVAAKADIKYIITQTHNIFAQAGVRQLYVQTDHATV